MPPATSADALAQYTSAAQSQKSPDQILQETSGALGVPAAQEQVSGLRQAITNTTNLLSNVAPSVYGRTQNSLVTSAQAGRQIENESAPIQSTLSKQGTDLSNDQSNLSGLLSQASTLAGLKQQGQSDKLTSLESIYKALYGQEQDKQAEADKQAAAAEQVREANLSSSSSSGGGGGGSGGSSSGKLSTQDYAKSMSAQLSTKVGSDGFVSPATYTAGMKAWAAEGLNPADYDKYMAVYRNPSNAHYLLSSGKYV